MYSNRPFSGGWQLAIIVDSRGAKSIYRLSMVERHAVGQKCIRHYAADRVLALEGLQRVRLI